MKQVQPGDSNQKQTTNDTFTGDASKLMTYKDQVNEALAQFDKEVGYDLGKFQLGVGMV